MRVHFVTPVKLGSTRGNGVTARRWARFSAEFGHETEIMERYEGAPCDVLVALHARRSHDSVLRFCQSERRRRERLIVALTGTDAYDDLPDSAAALESLELADGIVVLQDHARSVVPATLRSKVSTVLQSAEMSEAVAAARAAAGHEPRAGLLVVVIGHLREVKDPFRAAAALRRLPEDSEIRVVQVGEALSEAMEEQALREQTEQTRYRWLGGVSEVEAKRILAEADLVLLSSKMEGGANVISEAIVAGVPVISSRIGGSVGMLGEAYPGYFEVGDTDGLCRLLLRCEREPEFLRELRVYGERIRSRFLPAAERAAWADVLAAVSLA